jgi:hypothetical protein
VQVLKEEGRGRKGCRAGQQIIRLVTTLGLCIDAMTIAHSSPVARQFGPCIPPGSCDGLSV